MQLAWPSSVCRAILVAASYILTVLSPDADASCPPSGEKATALTVPVWPFSISSATLVATSHNMTILRADADASCLPFGEKATACTAPVYYILRISITNTNLPMSTKLTKLPRTSN
jgi:hypothetical protein